MSWVKTVKLKCCDCPTGTCYLWSNPVWLVILASKDHLLQWLETTVLWWRFASSTASYASERSIRLRCTQLKSFRLRLQLSRSHSPSASNRCGSSRRRCPRLTSILTIRYVHNLTTSSQTITHSCQLTISRIETSSSRYTWPQYWFNELQCPAAMHSNLFTKLCSPRQQTNNIESCKLGKKRYIIIRKKSWLVRPSPPLRERVGRTP